MYLALTHMYLALKEAQSSVCVRHGSPVSDIDLIQRAQLAINKVETPARSGLGYTKRRVT